VKTLEFTFMRRIPKRDGRRIAEAIMALRAGMKGDVKRLTNFTPEYRLRVGDWRIFSKLIVTRW